MPLRILHTNDLHGKMDARTEQALKPIRKECELYFDSGDAIRTGNVGVPIGPDSVWESFRKLNCTAGTCGNREFHISEQVFRAKISGCCHPLLVSNLTWNGKSRRPLQTDWPETPLRKSLRIGQVGVIGVMIPMVTARMAARHVSAFMNTDPAEAVRAEAEKLRKNCQLLICISHLGLKRDIELAQAVPELDLILGGHSHDTLQSPEHVGKTAICHAGSHARFAGVYEWDVGLRNAQLVPIR